MKKINPLFMRLVLAIIALASVSLAPVSAADNPIPLNWGQLTVQVIETYGNNNTKPLRGAKVKVELKDPEKAKALQEKYRTLKLPLSRTSQTRGAMFGKLPPSNEVGPYIVTVIPKPFDKKKEYICDEQTKEIRMSGGSPKRLTFNVQCKKADAVNESKRRASGKGYDLTVKVEQNTGTRGNGLWVYLFDKDGNRVKKIRTGGRAEAKFRKIDPALNPYKIEVYNGNKLLFTDTYKMPAQHSTYTADVN